MPPQYIYNKHLEKFCDFEELHLSFQQITFKLGKGALSSRVDGFSILCPCQKLNKTMERSIQVCKQHFNLSCYYYLPHCLNVKALSGVLNIELLCCVSYRICHNDNYSDIQYSSDYSVCRRNSALLLFKLTPSAAVVLNSASISL